MFMIKSNGGNGTVRQCTFSNFIGHKNAYTLNIDGHWTQLKLQPGDGVQYQDLNFTNWKGSCSDGVRRGPINVICPDGAPCHGINIDDFAVWTESGNRVLYKCVRFQDSRNPPSSQHPNISVLHVDGEY